MPNMLQLQSAILREVPTIIDVVGGVERGWLNQHSVFEAILIQDFLVGFIRLILRLLPYILHESLIISQHAFLSAVEVSV